MHSKPTILVVDHEASMRSGLADTISRHGFNVVTAADGRAGIIKAKEVMPDLTLSDAMMTAPDGFEMQRELSADPNLAAIPFIFLTTSPSMQEHINGPADGGVDFLTKPFVSEELLSRIESVLYRLSDGRPVPREPGGVAVREEIENFRSQILRNFGDQLRGPLGNVVMSLEMAISHRFEHPQEQAEFLRGALSNSDRLESLVSDMILLSDIDQSNLNRARQSVEVDPQIMIPIHRQLQRYEAKELSFVPKVNLKGPIMAPRHEFTQALLRLTDNAFKFSPDHGKVALIVSSSPNGGATVLIQDEGPGIPGERREKVFEHFYQISDEKHRGHLGLGVGLTIARAVFASVGGDVRIVDGPGGCRVEALLPDLRPEDSVNE